MAGCVCRASNRYNFSALKNYLVAVGLFAVSQLSAIVKGIADGFGGGTASKRIRMAMTDKLSALGMPYLWQPEHSTAQLTDLVTKDLEQFRQFSQLPLFAATGSFSIATIIYAKPLIAPLAVLILGAQKYTKNAFSWALRQIIGAVFTESSVRLRKLTADMYNASPTIKAMSREAEFERIINREVCGNECVTVSARAHSLLSFVAIGICKVCFSGDGSWCIEANELF